MYRDAAKVVAIALVLLSGACAANNPPEKKLQSFAVTIDWVPSPEYYGFFYARDKGLYRAAGLDVTIHYGTGAPAVAAQMAAGAIYAGTTTSDNALRQVAKGATFGSITPLLSFNPCVLASLASNPIKRIEDVAKRVIGTNPQTSVFQQFQFALASKHIDPKSFREYPIGYGGAAQLQGRAVDGMLAYTTNQVIDVEIAGVAVEEIFLGDLGVQSYGVVLVLGTDDQLEKVGLTPADAIAFIRATVDGYRRGAEDAAAAAAVLKKSEPTLNEAKVLRAVAKIGVLNERTAYSPSQLDVWLSEPGLTAEVRGLARELYGKRR